MLRFRMNQQTFSVLEIKDPFPIFFTHTYQENIITKLCRELMVYQCLQNIKANQSNSVVGSGLGFQLCGPCFRVARLLTVSRIVPFIKLKCYQMLRYEAEQFKGLFVQHYMVETAVPCNLAIWTSLTPLLCNGHIILQDALSKQIFQDIINKYFDF